MQRREAAALLAHLGAVALCVAWRRNVLGANVASVLWVTTLAAVVWTSWHRRFFGLGVLLSFVLAWEAILHTLLSYSCTQGIRGCP